MTFEDELDILHEAVVVCVSYPLLDLAPLLEGVVVQPEKDVLT